MADGKINFYKVATLPETPERNAIYFVNDTVSSISETYITSNDEVPVVKLLGNSSMINDIFLDRISTQSWFTIVENITQRNALVPLNTQSFLVLVLDASIDVTVGENSALYAFKPDNQTFVKVAEYENMDKDFQSILDGLNIDWAQIQNAPVSTPESIDLSVSYIHTHANIENLDNLNENQYGLLTYLGVVVGSNIDNPDVTSYDEVGPSWEVDEWVIETEVIETDNETFVAVQEQYVVNSWTSYEYQVLDTSNNFVGNDLWKNSVIGDDLNIYAMPYNATSVLKIDTTNDTMSLVDFGLTFDGNGDYASAVLGADGLIYAIPYNATEVLIIDSEIGFASKTDFGLDLSGTAKWMGACVATDGKIYCAPYDSTNVLVIDTSNGTASLVNYGLDLSGTAKWYGMAQADTGMVYGIPHDASEFIIINTNDGTARLSQLQTYLNNSKQWAGSVTAPDGRIICAPYNSQYILSINPANERVTKETYGAALNNNAGKFQGITVGSDGRLYGIPENSDTFLVIDAVEYTASLESLGSTSVAGKYCGASTSHNGKIYLVPSNTSDLASITPLNGAGLREAIALSIWYNKL